MKFKSTRGKAPVLSFSEALFAGLASDGGLYVPENLPQFKATDFSCETLHDVAELILSKFIVDEPLTGQISQICKSAFNFPINLESLDESTSLLELYHGPTAAFKDVGARFLAECIVRLGGQKSLTVIVATSGDTGGAVAGAFHGKSKVNVVILFPKGMVSKFQEKQLTCWGENIRAFKVRGTFDDCQRLVKEAFRHSDWKKRNLTSANSINIGRILPQTVYYAWSALKHYKKSGHCPNFIIPTGNLGNALAALWAKKMGFPIGKIVFSCNTNKSVVDYYETGKLIPRPAVTTLANAMDVGSPSNMERLLYLYPNLVSLKKDTEAYSVNDEEIKTEIKESYKRWGRIFCPHTATAASVRHKLPGKDWIIVSTAHPSKFKDVVEPLLNLKIQDPATMELFENHQSQFVEIDAQLSDLAKALS
jgi:threonine synthase